MEDRCLFCAIVAGAVPAELVHDEGDIVAIRDIAPQAPVHVLVMPRSHHANAAAAVAADPELTARLVAAACRLAESTGIAQAGYRLVINTGEQGGQSVDHLHIHLLGDRQMGWPPG